jgi:transposase InsO family protein
MDFLGPLETSPEGYKYILPVVDSYSKWPEAFPLKTTDAVEVAWVLYREIFSRYGAPDALLSDRGQNFMSKLITEPCRLFQVTRLRTSSYHAQTNAQCERFNSFIGSALRSLCAKNTANWPKMLAAVLSAYRVTPCIQSTQFSPYFLLFKKECRLPLDVALQAPDTLPPGKTAECLLDIVNGVNHTQRVVKDNFLQAQKKYKTQYDKKAAPHKFVLGQRV